MGLSGVVLVVACLNLANMLLARGTARRREMAVRLAIGAGRGRIIHQLLTESLLLATVGAALGLVLGVWATRLLAASLTAVLPLALAFDPRPDATVLAATTGFAVLSTVAFGLGPALRLSRRDLVSDLKDLGADPVSFGRRLGARNLMVVTQVALSLGLLTAGGLFARSALDAAATDPGYRYDRLLYASLDPSLASFDEPRGRAIYAVLLQRLRARPDVVGASFASTVPFGDIHEGEQVERVGRPAPPDQPRRGRTFRIVGADYFSTLGLSMVRGREFTPAEEGGSPEPVVIIDAALARELFGADDPLGQMIRIVPRPGDRAPLPEPMRVVGIAPDIRESLLSRAPEPHLYVPFGRLYRANMHLHVRLGPGVDAQAALAAVRADIRRAEPALPVLALSTMQAFHDRSLELWAVQARGRLFTALGLLALLLAVVGLYGLTSYVVAQRTREIGIRMALGASPAAVGWMVLRDGLALTGAGLLVGLPLAALVSVALTKVFVEVGGFDPLVVSVAACALAAAAALAAAIPARRATRVAPLTAQRAE